MVTINLYEIIFDLKESNEFTILDMFDTCYVTEGKYYIYSKSNKKSILSKIKRKISKDESVMIKHISSVEKEDPKKKMHEAMVSVCDFLDRAINELEGRAESE